MSSTDEVPKRTYHEQAVQDAGETQGGRWRNTDVSVAGTAPCPHSDKLVAPQWSADVGPPEPPTGECIDAVQSMETVSGIDRAEALAIDSANAAPAPEEPTDQ
jgi:hypothetical protein